jgi:hypothetical protein
MPKPRDAVASALLPDGRVLIVGGADFGANGAFPWAYLYNP